MNYQKEKRKIFLTLGLKLWPREASISHHLALVNRMQLARGLFQPPASRFWCFNTVFTSGEKTRAGPSRKWVLNCLLNFHWPAWMNQAILRYFLSTGKVIKCALSNCSTPLSTQFSWVYISYFLCPDALSIQTLTIGCTAKERLNPRLVQTYRGSQSSVRIGGRSWDSSWASCPHLCTSAFCTNRLSSCLGMHWLWVFILLSSLDVCKL